MNNFMNKRLWGINSDEIKTYVKSIKRDEDFSRQRSLRSELVMKFKPNPMPKHLTLTQLPTTEPSDVMLALS